MRWGTFRLLSQSLPTPENGARILKDFPIKSGPYALATIHRAENTDDPAHLVSVLRSLGRVAQLGLPVVVPLHPRTRRHLAIRGRRRWFTSSRP